MALELKREEVDKNMRGVSVADFQYFPGFTAFPAVPLAKNLDASRMEDDIKIHDSLVIRKIDSHVDIVVPQNIVAVADNPEERSGHRESKNIVSTKESQKKSKKNVEFFQVFGWR